MVTIPSQLLTKGYSIFYYDRLGVGKSEQGLGYVAQLSNQVAILTELAKLVKGRHYVGGTGRPSKTVLVGHGFGSAISSEVVRKNRKLVDGVVLTGRLRPKTAFSLYEEMGG